MASSTLVDVLLVAVFSSLALKAAATIVLLSVDKDVRYRPGWGAGLWWTTKVAPFVAALCAIWIGVLDASPLLVAVSAAVTLFAVVAVPIKIRQRRSQIAERTSSKPIA